MAQVPGYGDDMPLLNPVIDEHAEASGTKSIPLTGGICTHCGGVNSHGMTPKGKPCPRKN